MRGGKPTVPENIRGTSTLIGSDSVHTSNFIILLYKLHIVAISAYLKLFHLENYACMVAFVPDLKGASFLSVKGFLFHRTTTKLVSFYSHENLYIRSLKNCCDDQESLSASYLLWRAISCTAANTNRYFQLKRLLISASAISARMFHITIICNLRVSIKWAKLVAVRCMAVL